MKTEHLISEMVTYYSGDAKRIQHFLKVHNIAKLIGALEKLDDDTIFILETAAIVHDIGIKVCEQKYGNCNGKLQEKEGPALAKDMLRKLNYDPAVIERTAYLVGHHHTYNKIDSIDYQILVEADFLVNIYEDNLTPSACHSILNKVFKTESGIDLLRRIYAV